MNLASASIAVSGVRGFLEIVALVLFLVATIVAAVIAPRNWWAVGVAGGLFFWMLSILIK